jgi:hypothetical protein
MKSGTPKIEKRNAGRIMTAQRGMKAGAAGKAAGRSHCVAKQATA